MIDTAKYKSKPKFFCIGRNKTGTTSIKKAFVNFGFSIGNQRIAENLMDDYFVGNFEIIIDYCKSAQFFQDVPFSYPNTYRYIDEAFPKSKFILTVRDSPEQWYNSLVRFHSKSFGLGSAPVLSDLKEIEYISKGWVYNNLKRLHKLNVDDNPYDREMLINHYNNYNNEILDYFKDRPDDLLVLNVSDTNSYKKLAEFVGVKINENDSFPWENKTDNL